MKSVRVITDLTECREAWNQMIPPEQLSDLWEVRDCFQRQYGHLPHFVVYEDGAGTGGFLPLCFNPETGSYLFFPGETWHGKTWLEQNRLIVKDKTVLRCMASVIPGNYSLRYLQPSDRIVGIADTIDEVGYVFLPPQYDYKFDNYLAQFSGRSAKRLRKELQVFEERGVEFTYNDESDFEIMVALNVRRYGQNSYFADPRFLRSFRSLFHLLSARKWLRLTTVRIGGKIAAIDIGCVYNGTYTLLAGGTRADFPGVAKLINMHHIKWACENRVERVDFLCGDFNWKTLFHLTPSPLYLIKGTTPLQPNTVASPSCLIPPLAWFRGGRGVSYA